MNVSSRTPEGEYNRCPLCGHAIWIAPSQPQGDAPCPHCGVLLSFHATDAGILFSEQNDARERELGPFVKPGDTVRVIDGTFESFQGEVAKVDYHAGRVTINITVYGRTTPVMVKNSMIELA